MNSSVMVLLAAVGGIAGALAAGQEPVAKQQAADADVAAIRANIEAFSKAYQARDVKAIAALFAPEATMVTDDNEVVEGREAIARGFADHFEEEAAAEPDPAAAIEARPSVSHRDRRSDLRVRAGAVPVSVVPAVDLQEPVVRVLALPVQDGPALALPVQDGLESALPVQDGLESAPLELVVQASVLRVRAGPALVLPALVGRVLALRVLDGRV